MRLSGNRALVKRALGHGTARLHRTEQRQQCGDIVRADVHERACARVIIKCRIGVEGLTAVIDDKCRGADDLTDFAGVQNIAAGLQPCAQKGIRCTADAQMLGLRQVHQLFALGIGEGERLFRVDMLAAGQRQLVEPIVRVRRGQIENQIHIRLFNQILCTGVGVRDAEFLSFFLCLFQAARSTGVNGHKIAVFFQVVEIDAADVTETDDADAQFFHGKSLLAVVTVSIAGRG